MNERIFVQLPDRIHEFVCTEVSVSHGWRSSQRELVFDSLSVDWHIFMQMREIRLFGILFRDGSRCLLRGCLTGARPVINSDRHVLTIQVTEAVTLK